MVSWCIAAMQWENLRLMIPFFVTILFSHSPIMHIQQLPSRYSLPLSLFLSLSLSLSPPSLPIFPPYCASSASPSASNVYVLVSVGKEKEPFQLIPYTYHTTTSTTIVEAWMEHYTIHSRLLLRVIHVYTSTNQIYMYIHVHTHTYVQ